MDHVSSSSRHGWVVVVPISFSEVGCPSFPCYLSAHLLVVVLRVCFPAKCEIQNINATSEAYHGRRIIESQGDASVVLIGMQFQLR